MVDSMGGVGSSRDRRICQMTSGVHVFFGGGIWMLGCTKPEYKEKKQEASSSERVSFYDEQHKPSVLVSNAFPRQRKMIVDAYQQNLVYYEQFNKKEVAQIRFVGIDAPWKPEAERHYCIDAPQRKSIAGEKEKEDVYYFANYCRSLSTLFREADKIFKSYVDFESCTDICNCAIENHLAVFPKTAKSCVRYCEDMTWEQFCTVDVNLERKCCL